MNVLRWILCFPAAYLASFILMVGVQMVLPHSWYGGGFLRSAVGLAPTVLHSAIPTAAFAVMTTVMAPSASRIVPFVSFGLALLFSCGHMSALHYQDHGGLPFWLAIEVGLLGGALVALPFSLYFQRRRAQMPNQSLQPTATAVTPPAAQEARQP